MVMATGGDSARLYGNKCPRFLDIADSPARAGPKPLTHGTINHFYALWLCNWKRIVFSGDEPGHGVRLYVQAGCWLRLFWCKHLHCATVRS